MKKLWRRSMFAGFTLIELLVVISIIAILAAVLTPAVTDALTRGKMTGTMNNGRSIYLSLFAKDTEDPVFNTGSPFPRTIGSLPLYTESTTYWKYVVTSGVMNVDFSFFSAPNITPIKSTDPSLFGEANNAWCITADVGEGTPDGTPLLFTRNLNINRTDATDLADPLQLTANPPFGTKGVVVVTKGGSSMVLKKDYIDANFNPTGGSNTVLRPKVGLD